MILVRQWTQGLGQQPRLLHVDVEVALAGLVDRALTADDVADIPGLDMVVVFTAGNYNSTATNHTILEKHIIAALLRE